MRTDCMKRLFSRDIVARDRCTVPYRSDFCSIFMMGGICKFERHRKWSVCNAAKQKC